ncbi:hypothetical protein [Embleya scabrispora]|uniref:hypothetical protein n=1 Tax=Embleya scabrispora TaxID=159449 RepID=UPI000362DCFB|nr:hypothetical protein [Embleya scabrispora]MYS85683.1 hypothetical protein [Streptomyces sp. SID5474]
MSSSDFPASDDSVQPISLSAIGTPLTLEDVSATGGCGDGCGCAGGGIDIDADLLDAFVTEQVLVRLESEPAFVARSIAALAAGDDLDAELAEEIEELESDPVLLLDVLGATRETLPDMESDAVVLLFRYVIDHVALGPEELPLEERVQIEWRVPPVQV